MIDPGKWLDIGFPWNLLEGNRRLLKKKTDSDIKGTVEEDAHIIGPVNLREKVRVSSSFAALNKQKQIISTKKDQLPDSRE